MELKNEDTSSHAMDERVKRLDVFAKKLYDMKIERIALTEELTGGKKVKHEGLSSGLVFADDKEEKVVEETGEKVESRSRRESLGESVKTAEPAVKKKMVSVTEPVVVTMAFTEPTVPTEVSEPIDTQPEPRQKWVTAKRTPCAKKRPDTSDDGEFLNGIIEANRVITEERVRQVAKAKKALKLRWVRLSLRLLKIPVCSKEKKKSTGSQKKKKKKLNPWDGQIGAEKGKSEWCRTTSQPVRQ